MTAAAVAALSGGHLLIEDVPGVGKTVLARALATVARGPSCRASRATPTCCPPTSPGVTVFSPGHRHVGVPARPGVRPRGARRRAQPDAAADPVGAARGHGGAAGVAWTASRGRCPDPTWSSPPRTPSASSGTYPLVESQLDRFALATSIGYPDAEIEARLVLHNGGPLRPRRAGPGVPTRPSGRGPSAPRRRSQVVTDRGRVRRGPGRATRIGRDVRLGASPRAAISLIRAAQAHAVLSGRAFVTPRRRPGRGRGLPGPPAHHRGQRRRRSDPGHPDRRRHARPPDVNARRTDRRTLVWRTVNAATTGLLAGLVAVIAVRTVFGPAVVVAGAVVGLLAMLAGVIVSWGVFARRSARRHRSAFPDRYVVRSWLHPVAWFAPVVGSVVAVLAWAGVAHSSGSGWVQAVGALLAAVLAAGLVAPLFPARRAVVTCTGCPSDGEAGRPVEVTVDGQRAGPGPAPASDGPGGPGGRRPRGHAGGRGGVHPGAAGGARRRRGRAGLVRAVRAALVGPGGRGPVAPAAARGAAVRRSGPAGEPARRPRPGTPRCGCRPGPGSPEGCGPTGPATSAASIHWPATCPRRLPHGAGEGTSDRRPHRRRPHPARRSRWPPRPRRNG